MKIELVVKKPYEGSGPRGIDVYGRQLYQALSTIAGHEVTMTHDKPSGQGDIVHYTFFDSYRPTLHLKGKIPTVVTVHDLIPHRFPDHFPAGIRGTLQWLRQRKKLQKVEAIVTDSWCSQRDIARLIPYPSSRIFPIYLGPNNPASAKKNNGKIASLPDKYVLYVGDINWNKNIPGLIRAFSSIEDDSLSLVLVGKAFRGASDIPEMRAINREIERSRVQSRVVMPGYVADEDMPALYANAMLYIQPSWYEGFGLPVLEAMQYGCPVLSSREGSLHEIGGEYVHYFTPADEAGFAKTLGELVQDATRRTRHVTEAKRWAQTFTWERTAEETLKVYKQVLAAPFVA